VKTLSPDTPFLGANAIVLSMSTVGICADNATCEGFFGVLKRERVLHKNYRTRDKSRADLFDFLETFQNPRMRHSVARRDREFSELFKPSLETGKNPGSSQSRVDHRGSIEFTWRIAHC
jgi:putative transposase